MNGPNIAIHNIIKYFCGDKRLQIIIDARQSGKTAIKTELMKNKLKNMQQLNGRVETKLDNVVMLRCDAARCGQVHFAREPGSLCPDCQKGNLEVVENK